MCTFKKEVSSLTYGHVRVKGHHHILRLHGLLGHNGLRPTVLHNPQPLGETFSAKTIFYSVRLIFLIYLQRDVRKL
jgi:hypothetical protein